MKHIQKEWFTCDRCGNRIDQIPSNVLPFPLLRRSVYKTSELNMITADVAGYITNTELISPEIASVEIMEYYDRHEKNYSFMWKVSKILQSVYENGGLTWLSVLKKKTGWRLKPMELQLLSLKGFCIKQEKTLNTLGK